MAEYKVNADFHVNVVTYVEADTEEEAKKEAIQAILNHDCDLLDPLTEPKINWAESEANEE